MTTLRNGNHHTITKIFGHITVVKDSRKEGSNGFHNNGNSIFEMLHDQSQSCQASVVRTL